MRNFEAFERYKCRVTINIYIYIYNYGYITIIHPPLHHQIQHSLCVRYPSTWEDLWIYINIPYFLHNVRNFTLMKENIHRKLMPPKSVGWYLADTPVSCQTLCCFHPPTPPSRYHHCPNTSKGIVFKPYR